MQFDKLSYSFFYSAILVPALAFPLTFHGAGEHLLVIGAVKVFIVQCVCYFIIFVCIQNSSELEFI